MSNNYSTNAERKGQLLMSNIVLILRENRLLPLLTAGHVTEWPLGKSSFSRQHYYRANLEKRQLLGYTIAYIMLL